MRLWSLLPNYLDSKGLVALWREALLAQNVLLGNTKGYTNHPQLNRFKATSNPSGAIAKYLRAIADEADNRNYNFQRSKIINKRYTKQIPVTSGQLQFEVEHLKRKLKKRDSERFINLRNNNKIELHPLFREIDGGIEGWEIV